MTERKRAGGRRTLAEAAATKTRPAVEPVSEPQAPMAAQPPPEAHTVAARSSGTKYTAVLDDDTVDAFEHLTRIARRRLGRHVDKIEVLRTLLLLAADDASLRDHVIANIGDRVT